MVKASWFTVPVVVALAVGLIIGFAAGAYKSGSETATSTDKVIIEENATTTSGTIEAGAVEVGAVDQPAGKTVSVSQVKVDKTAWIAVRDYKEGKLGGVLGAHRLPADFYSQDQIELLRETVASSTYAVVVYYDDGDFAFNNKTDVPVAIDGNLVFATFTAK